jgi:catechol 2,3-dioxygenase-like lactoylglutathione lyase family enzyme
LLRPLVPADEAAVLAATTAKHVLDGREAVAEVTPRLRQVVLDSTDVRRSAEFWRQLLGLSYRPGQEPPPPGQDDPDGRDWLNLRLPDGSPLLAFQQVAALARTTWPDTAVPQQLHLDTSVRDVAELDAVHDRVLALGGTLRLDRSDDEEEPLRVYADPDGHPFCVFVADD